MVSQGRRDHRPSGRLLSTRIRKVIRTGASRTNSISGARLDAGLWKSSDKQILSLLVRQARQAWSMTPPMDYCPDLFGRVMCGTASRTKCHARGHVRGYAREADVVAIIGICTCLRQGGFDHLLPQQWIITPQKSYHDMRRSPLHEMSCAQQCMKLCADP